VAASWISKAPTPTGWKGLAVSTHFVIVLGAKVDALFGSMATGQKWVGSKREKEGA
jgi:hypothetical protein